MGLRGPAPKPTELRKIEGNPSRRPFPPREPRYPVHLPERPKRMSPRASLVWDELAGEMACAGVLRSVDRRALWQLCEDEALIAEAYAGIWKMAKAVEKTAKLQGQKLPGGAIMSLLGMKNGRMAMAAVRDLAARTVVERREFGLTPSSRSRIEAIENGSSTLGDPLEAKLCG